MKPLSCNQKDHIQAAVLHRYLEYHMSFVAFSLATKYLSTDRFDEHFLVQGDRIFLNTSLPIASAFNWKEASENGWGTSAEWQVLQDNWDSFYDIESRKIDSFLESILCHDLQRFFDEEQGIGIDIFIAEIVRQKSIDFYGDSPDVSLNAIYSAFEWVEAIELSVSWGFLSAEWHEFYQSKSEVAAL